MHHNCDASSGLRSHQRWRQHEQLGDSGQRSGFRLNLSRESVARFVWALMLPTVCSVASRQTPHSWSRLQLVTSVIATRVAPDRPRSKMLHSFRVLRRQRSGEAVHSEVSARKLHVGLFTSGQFALADALVMSIWRRSICHNGDASAGSKGHLPACAQHVANVYTFSGDRSGFLMSFHLRVSR